MKNQCENYFFLPAVRLAPALNLKKIMSILHGVSFSIIPVVRSFKINCGTVAKLALFHFPKSKKQCKNYFFLPAVRPAPALNLKKNNVSILHGVSFSSIIPAVFK